MAVGADKSLQVLTTLGTTGTQWPCSHCTQVCTHKRLLPWNAVKQHLEGLLPPGPKGAAGTKGRGKREVWPSTSLCRLKAKLPTLPVSPFQAKEASSFVL